MTNGKLIWALLIVLGMTGCQSFSHRNVESLPPTAALPESSEPGWVELRYFDAIDGNRLSALDGVAKFPDNPDEIVRLSQLEVPSNRADNYASLVRGYIEPPVTGTYRFYVSGDDETRFSLSTDASAASLSTIASVPSYSSSRQFDKFSSQTSPQMSLTAGKRYYFELLHKEGVGGDHFAVAWEGPGFARSIVTSEYLYSPSEASQRYTSEEDVIAAFRQGYRVGYFDAQQSLAFNDEYPPLDEDQDGLYDNWEVQYGLNPSDPLDSSSDADDDLLSAEDEYALWSNPAASDSDGDGIPDGAEFAYGLDPLDPSDASGDLDGDGYSNLDEYIAATNPTDASDVPEEEAPLADVEYVAGLMGQYFSGRRFDQFRFSRQDTTPTQNWGGNSPGTGIASDNFSVRWYTTIFPPHDSGTRTYRISVKRDDSIRVIVDGQVVLDSWTGDTSRTYTGDMTLTAGTAYPTTIEFSEGYGRAYLEFNVVDTVTGQTVPPETLYRIVPLSATVSPDTDSDGVPDVWEMAYGTDAWTDDSGTAYNSSGVTVAQAYETDANPWTLETVDSWDGQVLSGGVVVPSEPDTTSPPTTTTPEPSPSYSVTVSWVAPSTRADGSSISLSEIASYRLNYGTNANNLSMNVSVPSDESRYTFENLDAGTWYFSVQVVDYFGLISEPSEVVSRTIP